MIRSPVASRAAATFFVLLAETGSFLHKFLHNSQAKTVGDWLFNTIGPPESLHSPEFCRITRVFTNWSKCYEPRQAIRGRRSRKQRRPECRKVKSLGYNDQRRVRILLTDSPSADLVRGNQRIAKI